MAKYLDPKADVTFKKVFGEHKNLVISLLNALLPLDEGKQVESIEYLPAEMLQRTPIADDSFWVLDVLCMETGGRRFIVELQAVFSVIYRWQVVRRDGKAYVRQRSLSEEYRMPLDVYSLVLIACDIMSPDEQCWHHYPKVLYRPTGKVLEGLHLVFVELPKFSPQSFTEKKMAVLWLKFLTQIDEKTRVAPQELLDNSEVSQALEIVEESVYSDAERAAYEGFWDGVGIEATKAADCKRAKENLAKLETAEAERDAEKARADAAVERLRQTARNLKAMKLTAEQIAAATGLTAAEIDS